MSQIRTTFAMNSAQGKQVLSLIRDGNYAHPGEEAAIKQVFSQIPQSSNHLLLDVGCGLGGTAAYIQNHGWGKVIGIDIDPKTIENAQRLYPNLSFYLSDVLNINEVLKEQADIIYLFNAFYAFPQQQQALSSMRKVAKKDTTLLIFDYILRGDYQDARTSMNEPPEIPYPINEQQLPEMLQQAHWHLIEIKNLDDAYIGWYEPFVEKIQIKKQEITSLVGLEGFKLVYYLYSHLLNEIKANRLGGCLVKAVAV